MVNMIIKDNIHQSNISYIWLIYDIKGFVEYNQTIDIWSYIILLYRN